MRDNILIFSGILLALAACAAAARGSSPKFREIYPPQNDVMIDHHVAIPMRDGITLYADVYRPVATGKYPVLVCRTPYSTQRYPVSYEEPVFFSSRGFVYVFQDVRGRHESEGKWEPFRNDIEDGYDTIEWAARQPCRTGKSACRDTPTAVTCSGGRRWPGRPTW